MPDSNENISVDEILNTEMFNYEKQFVTNTDDTKKFNPLAWWGKNSLKYPLMSKIAKSILCVPASSSETERVFSTAGKICRKDRARLHPDAVEAPVVMADYLKKSLLKNNYIKLLFLFYLCY